MLHGFENYKEDWVKQWGPSARYQHFSFKKENDTSIVKPGECRVSEQQLHTAGLMGCTAFCFTQGKKNFLAHVDGRTSIKFIQEIISRNFDVAALKRDEKLTIIMWATGEISKGIVETALQSLGLGEKLIDMTSMDEVGPMTEVGVDTSGTFCEQPSMIKPVEKKSYPSLVTKARINSNLVVLTSMFAKHAKLASQDNPPEPMASLQEWNDWLQTHFLRPAGTDHQDIAKVEKHPLHDIMRPLFRELGLLDAVYPSRKQFDVIAIFGGSPIDTRERMYHVAKLWEKGVKADRIIYINGRRKLHPVELEQHGLDTSDIDLPSQPDWIPPHEIPLYQHEMAPRIWEQMISKKSEMYRKFQVLTIEPPAHKSRATTEDTISALIRQNPGLKSVLLVSNAPYGPYQHETVLNVIDELQRHDIVVETSSSSLRRDVPTMPFLDTLARRVYTANTIEQRKLLRKKTAKPQ